MLQQQDIIDFFRQNNYDLRKSHNGRWIDQKCAADVVSVVSDCIYNYNSQNKGQLFTTLDIWHYDYTVENVEAIFMKPGVESNAAKNEYDKFFQQPMEMLAYAGVLHKEKNGKRNFYSVKDETILEYIAIRERNALFFIKTYIERVLMDSDLYDPFVNFFNQQTKESYEILKKEYSDFIIKNTKINGVVECNRIFIKVLNPLAYYEKACGTERGRMSANPITYDMLMYNRNNFRDIWSNKPKGLTRKEFAATHVVEYNDAYYKYQSVKAKTFLRMFNNLNRDGITEHLDDRHMYDKAIHMHHIFPEAEYPEICYYYENIIALTPTQHLNYAHPNGKTTEIDEQFQQLLLQSKTGRIYENLTSTQVEHIYEFDNFLRVLSIGFDEESILEIEEMDFVAVSNAINVHYGKNTKYDFSYPSTSVAAEETANYTPVSIGDKVKHMSLGIGVVEAIDEKYISIRFESKESKFEYPQAFEKGFLYIID